MFGFEKPKKAAGLASRVEKIAMQHSPVDAQIEKLIATPVADTELSSLIMKHQEIRAHQEAGNSSGIKDSQQLIDLEDQITRRAQEIGLLP